MTTPRDSIEALTFAIEEFWPSDKPGAALLAGEVAAEILHYLDANGYTVTAYDTLKVPAGYGPSTTVADGTRGM